MRAPRPRRTGPPTSWICWGCSVSPAEAPAKDSYQSTPEPPDQENMPDATTAPAEKYTGPTLPDVNSITLPEKPAS